MEFGDNHKAHLGFSRYETCDFCHDEYVNALRSQLAQARGLLERYGTNAGESYNECIACTMDGWSKRGPDGHTPNCKLRAFLAAREGGR